MLLFPELRLTLRSSSSIRSRNAAFSALNSTTSPASSSQLGRSASWLASATNARFRASRRNPPRLLRHPVNLYSWLAQPLRSSPITGPSTLIRAGPPLRLAVLCPRRFLPPKGSPSRGQRATSPMTWPSVSRHRFSSSTPAPTTSSRHLNTEHHQSDTQAALWLHHTQSVALSRGYAPTPVAMLSLFYDASAVVQPCSSSHRIPDPLLASRFRDRFPPRHLTGMTSRRFGLPACTASPEDLPPSLAQHGSQKRPSTSLPFSFEDTRA